MSAESEKRSGSDEQSRRSVGRPPHSEEAIAQRKREIVEAAYEVFAERGYHATGVADIAQRLGVGHGTIYRYFDNKRVILDHVVDLALVRVLDGLVVGDLGKVDSAAAFRTQLTRLADSFDKQISDSDPALLRLIVLDAAAIDEELLQRILGLLEAAVATLGLGLEEAKRRGYLRPGLDANSAARALVGCALSGIAVQMRDTGVGRQARLTYVDTVVSLICDNVEPGGVP
ncbi:MAG: TetR/AcrR family transcriptional regulator [Marmoricola sp.]